MTPKNVKMPRLSSRGVSLIGTLGILGINKEDRFKFDLDALADSEPDHLLLM